MIQRQLLLICVIYNQNNILYLYLFSLIHFILHWKYVPKSSNYFPIFYLASSMSRPFAYLLQTRNIRLHIELRTVHFSVRTCEMKFVFHLLQWNFWNFPIEETFHRRNFIRKAKKYWKLIFLAHQNNTFSTYPKPQNRPYWTSFCLKSLFLWF